LSGCDVKNFVYIGIGLLVMLLAPARSLPAVEPDSNILTVRGSDNVSSEFNLGMDLYQRGDYLKALDHFRKAADSGDLQATVQIGLMYEFGRGVKEDYLEALNWYTKAAEKGEPRALYLIGHMYEYGEGVTIDPDEAFVWYLKSAQLGHSSAQYEVGKIMTRDNPKDTSSYLEGIKWLRVAAEQCHHKSIELLRQVADGKVDTSRCPGAQVN